MVNLDPRRLRFPDYFAYFEGNLDRLFDVPATQANGLAYIPPNEITSRFNYPAAASRFFIDAMLGDVPDAVRLVYALFERLVKDWAVTGEYCVISTSQGIRVIRPDNVFPMPVGSPDNEITDYLLVYPNRDPNGHPTGTAYVVAYNIATRRAMANTRAYSPGVLDDYGTEPVPTDVFDVIWANTGDGMYPLIEGVVRELNVRGAMLGSALNSTSYPLLKINIDALANVQARRDMNVEKVNGLAKSGLGIIVDPEFTGEAEPGYIERTGRGIDESLDFVRLLLGLLTVLSGVPDYVYGVSLNQNPSEIERVMFAGQAKITRLRRNLETTFERLGISFRFTSEPFTTKKSRQDGVRQLYVDGVLTLNETRVALGWPPLLTLQGFLPRLPAGSGE